MRSWGRAGVASMVIVVAACGSQPGHQAPEIDAPAAPTFAISVGDPQVFADPLVTRTITVTGPASTDVVISLDRTTAGSVAPTTLTLDASGNGSAVLTPCTDVAPGCVGAANLGLATAAAPDTAVGTAALTLVAPPVLGNTPMCLTGGNVMYLDGNNELLSGTAQSSPTAVWTAIAGVDQIELDVSDVSGTYTATFSLLELPSALVPGTYDHAQAVVDGGIGTGNPGIGVTIGQVSCDTPTGEFQIVDYVADPVYGTPESVTISFEQVCNNEPTLLEGCFHYEFTPPAPATPPAPDPAKVSVQVLSGTGDGTPDTTATAIFTDIYGVTLLETAVDSFGEAAVAMPDGGEVTVLTYPGGYYEELWTYGGLSNGDHVVIHPTATRNGASDQMLGTFTPPQDSNGMTANAVSLMTGCGGGVWGGGNSPVGAWMTFYDGCRTPTFDMLTVAAYPEAVPQQFIWQTGLTHDANANVAVTGTWQDITTLALDLTAVPPGPAIGVNLQARVGPAVIQFGTTQISVTAPTDETLDLKYPVGGGDGAVATLTIYSSMLSSETHAVDQSGQPSSLAVDFTSQPIPIVGAITQTATGMTWTTSGSGNIDIRSGFWRGIMTNGERVTWYFNQPDDGQTSLSLTPLPADLVDADPTVDPTAQLTGASVGYTDYDVLSGYSITLPKADYRLHANGAGTYATLFPQ